MARAVKKETYKSRVTAEEYYNELFSLTARKDEILQELKDINLKLQNLEKSQISNDRQTIAQSRWKK